MSNKLNSAHRYAGILLVTEAGKLIGQHRDNIPGIDNPGKIGTFGGTVESGEEPLHAAWRELVKEETNLIVKESSLKLFLRDKAWRELTKEWEERYFYYVKITDEQLGNLQVYEGQGWAEIQGSKDPDLIELWRPVITAFTEL